MNWKLLCFAKQSSLNYRRQTRRSSDWIGRWRGFRWLFWLNIIISIIISKNKKYLIAHVHVHRSKRVHQCGKKAVGKEIAFLILYVLNIFHSLDWTFMSVFVSVFARRRRWRFTRHAIWRLTWPTPPTLNCCPGE